MDSDELRSDATRSPALKLLLRLVHLEAHPEGTQLVWCVPRICTPAALDRDARIIDQYLAQPLLIEGELAEQVQRVRAQRPRAEADGGDAPPRKRSRVATGRKHAHRAPRVPQWIENEFIEDSDEELAFALADVPRTSSRSASPHPLFLETHASPHTSPEASPEVPVSPKVRTRPAAHDDPLFLFDSDRE